MRLPNPRLGVPILISAISGAVVGYFVTDASCAPTSCPIAASLVAVAVALAAGAGVAVVVVLAVRSFAEWRTQEERDVLVPVSDDQPPGGGDTP